MGAGLRVRVRRPRRRRRGAGGRRPPPRPGGASARALRGPDPAWRPAAGRGRRRARAGLMGGLGSVAAGDLGIALVVASPVCLRTVGRPAALGRRLAGAARALPGVPVAAVGPAVGVAVALRAADHADEPAAVRVGGGRGGGVDDRLGRGGDEGRGQAGTGRPRDHGHHGGRTQPCAMGAQAPEQPRNPHLASPVARPRRRRRTSQGGSPPQAGRKRDASLTLWVV